MGPASPGTGGVKGKEGSNGINTIKNTLGNPGGLTQDSGKATRAVPKGVQKQKTGKTDPFSGVNRPVIRSATTPTGFDIEQARKVYLDRTRGVGGKGSKLGAGGMMQPKDDGGASGGDEHNPDDGHTDHDEDDYTDGYDDGYHAGHEEGEENHGDQYINNYYTHSYGSPNGWWYMYGDYDGDGYTDYVCTNGYNSVYWYGWSGSYWGSSPWYGWYGYGYGGSYSWWYNSVSDRYRGPIYGQSGNLTTDPSYSSVPVNVEEIPEALPLSAVEVARLEMSIGNPDLAIDAYRSHLSEFPNDWLAVRELGLAKVRLGDRGDGIAMVSYAYSMDPTLAYEPVPMSLFENSDRLMRDAVIDVVGWGHRNPSSSAWMTVAVLMQGEGRNGPALRMIERAREYGLDAQVDQAMVSVLSVR